MRDATNRLSNKTRLVVLAVTVTTILGVINFEIMKKEAIIENGSTVLLRIAPRDPRSLLQGDYMALRYAMAGTVAGKAKDANMTDGLIVAELAESGEASFVAIYDGQPLNDTQHLLRFRRRGESVRLASDAFFFEEGQWEIYQRARFGELKVSNDGEAVLVGLRNDMFERLGTAVLLSPSN
jgi:uncharacterized membrane-anchored protein